jgi:hypothetical protein
VWSLLYQNYDIFTYRQGALFQRRPHSRYPFSSLAAFLSVTFSRCRSPIAIIFSPLHMASPIPQISISPPPPQELLIEPYSPFSAASFLTSSLDDDGFRHRHLTPPPTHTKFNRQLSPLRPSEVAHIRKGLGRERFEALLKASKERNAALGGKKDVDLRKEIALKAHKNKQGVLAIIKFFLKLTISSL